MIGGDCIMARLTMTVDTLNLDLFYEMWSLLMTIERNPDIPIEYRNTIQKLKENQKLKYKFQ